MEAQYKYAIWSPSPNFSKRKDPISTIVIHITDGQADITKAVDRMRKSESQVSAHFMVGRAGEVVQMVQLENSAWHATKANSYSIGIEHCARSPGELSKTDLGLPVTDEQYSSSAKLVAFLCKKRAIAVDRDHILGHCELKNPDGSFISTHRDCPNKIWDWDRYMDLIKNS